MVAGTDVAPEQCIVTSVEALRAAMRCPTCGVEILPDPESSAVVAWYTCSRCDHVWSARIRDGRPAPDFLIDVSSLVMVSP